MRFWIFILIMQLLLPLTMIGFGNYFYKKAPAKINWAFGYRTAMSMQNKDTWEFAHHYFGKLWRVIGGIMLVVSIIAMVFMLGKEEATVGVYSGIISAFQIIVLIGPIFPTEIALKKNFDKNGNRRK